MSDGAKAARVALAVVGLLGIGACDDCNDTSTASKCPAIPCGPGTFCNASTGRCQDEGGGVTIDQRVVGSDRGLADQATGGKDLGPADGAPRPDAPVPSCSDKVKNGDETDVDCGGTKCGPCTAGKTCGGGSDCDSFFCSASKVCAYAKSCQELHASNSAAKDGAYPVIIPGASSAAKFYCDMTRDGGGWTLVANYPEGSPAVPPGWTTDKVVGTDFSTLTSVFKLSDKDVNGLKTAALRVDGTASECLGTGCSVRITLFYKPTCVYSSSSTSADCSNSFTDLAFTKKTTAGGTNPCTWHWGLVETNCGSIATLVTQHDPSHGFVVCVGDVGTFGHGCNGRGAEKAGVKIWAR